jgi:signal transduction histidine kinase
VRDHGAGLPVNEPERIFEKFYRAHPKHPGGVGLGLSIAKRLIELQQGSVSAHNHSEGGAVFDIFLPTVQSIIQSNSILGNPIHEPAIS